MADFYRSTEHGLTLHVRVTPRAAADRIDGVELRDNGQNVLRVRVRAVPDKGKANAAVIALLAEAFGVPNSSVAVISGETARMKTIAITGDAALLVDVARRFSG
ncbi:MAG TPA: DUF167 family protein [Devosiaceae bacterium]|nr:DUF167 family protein [Devosiaceae bacterium]